MRGCLWSSHTVYHILITLNSIDQIRKRKRWTRFFMNGRRGVAMAFESSSFTRYRDFTFWGFPPSSEVYLILGAIWGQILKGGKMIMLGGQMEGWETSLIWMTAKELMGNKPSLDKCIMKEEKGYQLDLWVILRIRVDVKPFLLLTLNWSWKRRKSKNWWFETAGDLDAISQGVSFTLCSYFPLLLQLFLSHLLELAILIKKQPKPESCQAHAASLVQ